MMLIYTAPMLTKEKKDSAFSLVEVVMVLFIISLVTLMSIIGYSNFSPKMKFADKANEIIDMFEMATVAADQSDRRYAVLVDFTDGSFTLYEVKTSNPYDRDNLLDEDIILSGYFNEDCQLVYVQFDDSPKTIDGGEEGTALFVVGHAGWDYGGKIVISDVEGNLSTIVVGRMNKSVKLRVGDVEIQQPEFDIDF